MSRRAANVVSQAEDTAINIAFYGEHEPAIDRNLADLLNWYNAMKTDKDAINYLIQYLDLFDREADIEKVKKIPSDWIPRTSAWLARLYGRDFPLSEHNKASIEQGLEKAFAHIDDSTPLEEGEKYVPNVQQRIREKSSEFIGEVNGMIDDGISVEEIDKWIRATFPSLPIIRKLIEKLQPNVDELGLAIKGEDDQLVEAYSRLSKKELLELYDTQDKLLKHVKRFADNIKSTKPRKKKAVNIDKVLANFKYKKTDDTYNLTSIEPRKVLNASELWLFNTRYLTLSVIRGNGLGIKGTSIVGYDETKSYSKRIGRKTGEVLKTVLSGGKVALRQLVDQPLKTNRTSDDTVLLRVL